MFKKIVLLPILILVITVSGLVACGTGVEPPLPPAGQTPAVSNGSPVVDYISLLDNLRTAGANVETAGEVAQTYFTVPGHVITVNGADVQVYEYPDADAAKKEAAFISSDGGQATVPGGPVTMIEWIAAPHFYRQSRLIVLYVGDEPGVISTLEAVLGPQYAGGVGTARELGRPVFGELTFNMLPLPLDRPISGQAANYVPHAWLIVADKVVPPTYGSYSVSYPDESAPKSEDGAVTMIVEHADALPPQENPDLATATLAADEQAIIVFSSEAIGQFTARVADWTDLYGPSERTLEAERELAGNLTAFTLEPTGKAGDQFLEVGITFDRGEASYFWRLNPGTAGSVPTTPEEGDEPAVGSGSPVGLIGPLVTASRLTFLGWSPDGETLAFLEHTPADLAVLPPFPPGTLNFLNARTGQLCDTTVVFPEGDYDRAGQLTWLPDGTLLVGSNAQTARGIPCQGEFSPYTDEAGLQEAVREPGLSPDGQHRASSEVRARNGGILSLMTTIATLTGGQVENVVEWQIDERLGDLGLGGEWLTGDTFLIHETLDQGPLLVTGGQGVRQVALDLFGLPAIPSILDPDGVSLRAAAATVAGTDIYHLALSGVGLEANFPPLLLYHSETGEVEELPFQHLGWPAFSPDGRWLVMDARPDQGGYERSELWLRPVDPAGGEARRLTKTNVALSVWSPDWAQVAGESPGGIAILSVPDGALLGLWQGGAYTLYPLDWSANGDFLAVSGLLPLDQAEALFVIQAKNGSSAQISEQTATYTDHVLGFAFDIPLAWTVDGHQGAEGHVIMPGETGGGQGILTFSVVGEGNLDFALAEVKRGAWGTHITAVQSVRLGEFEALRLELAPGEDRPPLTWLVATPSGQAVAFIPDSDPVLVEPVLASLRAVRVRALTDLPVATPLPCAGAEAELACEALVTFFERLHNKQYQEAAALYGGKYQVLIEYNPGLDPQDQAALLQNACALNGFQCLRVKGAVLLEQASPTAYTFAVEFANPDGSLFVRGPCCGADEAANPAESQFSFTVLEDSQGRFLVQDLPVYVP